MRYSERRMNEDSDRREDLTGLNREDNWDGDSSDHVTWEDIDSIQRQTPKPQHRKPRERIPVSVQNVVNEVDAYIEGGNFLTEKKFRDVAQETKGMEKVSHIQASLNAMAFWQSLCVPISR